MAACDLNELMPEARCNLCLSDKEISAVITSLLCQILQRLDPMVSCNVSDLLAGAREYLYLNSREIGAIQLHLLCQLANTSQLSGVSGGIVDPTADPGVDFQLYINILTGSVWYWNDTTGAWVPLIV